MALDSSTGYTATGPTLCGFDTGSGDALKGPITYGVNAVGDLCGVHGEGGAFSYASRRPSLFANEQTVGVSGRGGAIGVIGEGYEIAGVVGVTGESKGSGVLGFGRALAPGVVGLSTVAKVDDPTTKPNADDFPAGAGVFGASDSPYGAGVVGMSMNSVAAGRMPARRSRPSGTAMGVLGWSHTGVGTYGMSQENVGVMGESRSPTGCGVVGISGGDLLPALNFIFAHEKYTRGPAGVAGFSTRFTGVLGHSERERGGTFRSASMAQVRLVPRDLSRQSPNGDPQGVVEGKSGDLLVTVVTAERSSVTGVVPLHRSEAILWFCKEGAGPLNPKGTWVRIA